MINKKNKPAGLNISQFVESARQNVRPVSSISPAASEEEPEEKNEVQATSLQTIPEEKPMQTETVEDHAEKETAEVETSVSDGKQVDETASEENSRRKRPAQQKAVKRDKLVAIRFDKKTHKEISRIKLEYEIDIQDFVYIAVDRLKQEFFPNGKATREGIDIIRKEIDRINGKTTEE